MWRVFLLSIFSLALVSRRHLVLVETKLPSLPQSECLPSFLFSPHYRLHNQSRILSCCSLAVYSTPFICFKRRSSWSFLLQTMFSYKVYYKGGRENWAFYTLFIFLQRASCVWLDLVEGRFCWFWVMQKKVNYPNVILTFFSCVPMEAYVLAYSLFLFSALQLPEADECHNSFPRFCLAHRIAMCRKGHWLLFQVQWGLKNASAAITVSHSWIYRASTRQLVWHLQVSALV